LERLPPLQITLLDEARRYEALRDEMLARAALPFHQGWSGLLQVGERARKSGANLPAVQAGVVNRIEAAYQLQARLGRRLAILRAVEAVRCYAAAHNGQLPDSLAAVTMPLADDPITGRPLIYQRAGQSFTLAGPPPSGRERE